MNRQNTSLRSKLNRLPNPFHRIRKRFARYLLIAACTGTVSFLVALALLHLGFSPLVSLTLSVMVSGLANYAALELWGFPHRTGGLSWKRLGHSSIVGAGAFAARYGVLSFGLGTFQALAPFDKALALALAYGASFAIGYLLRSRVVFKHSASVRREGREVRP